jgi:hypothetical protein
MRVNLESVLNVEELHKWNIVEPREISRHTAEMG